MRGFYWIVKGNAWFRAFCNGTARFLPAKSQCTGSIVFNRNVVTTGSLTGVRGS